MGGFITFVVIVLIIFLIIRQRRKVKFLSERKMAHAAVESAQQAAQALGKDWSQRQQSIVAMFDARTATLSATYFADLHTINKGTGKTKSYAFFAVSRNLADLDNREWAYLRLAELLNAWKEGADPVFRRWRTGLIWGDGKGTSTRRQQYLGFANGTEALTAAVQRDQLSVNQVVSAMQQWMTHWLGQASLEPSLRPYLVELSERAAPGGGGAWLKPAALATSPFAPASDYALHIGSFPDGTPLNFSGDGSLVTIAPPGSGKTQCNVFPNLLTWRGPAVVLDVSGDIYEHTAAWRARNVGPVFRFSPLEPEASHRYNPLTFVRAEADYIWEDSRLLAEMMIVPSSSQDPFWENEARTVLTAAIAHVCYANPPDARPMHAVLDVLFGGDAWNSMIFGLRTAVDVRVMTQHATSLSSMNEKTLSSVLQTARSSLGAWSGERIARATSRSDWSPFDLRAGQNPTVYIYIRPNEVEAYLSLLRVFIGQHIRMLTGGPVPPHGSPPILFMLDELPRLRNMPPVDEALNIGRKYGLRLWMFAQSVGQLKDAYTNAEGMLGACAVRIYMNPSGADGIAEKVSEELGYVDSLNDNSRKRLVEAAELSGPTYRDKEIVLATGAKPVIVQKDFAYGNPELAARMALPAPEITPDLQR